MLRIERAWATAHQDALTLPDPPPRPGRRPRCYAIGDPQASLRQFLKILEHQRLLGEDGRLAHDVFLVAMGDYFDFGSDPVLAAQDGLALLAWLASHPPDQVVLIVGNHDLARVGELWRYDDRSFAQARAEALPLYTAGGDASAFLARHPDLPTTESVARDFSGFAAAQQRLVSHLLHSGRFQLAYAANDQLLFTHAGATISDLAPLLQPGERADAHRIAQVLNDALALAAAQQAGPLSIPGLHQPGDAKNGEGGGILYHRPAYPQGDLASFSGPFRRRFDPRQLPPGVTQAIGHIRDKKCRELLGPWVADAPGPEGPLRQLLLIDGVPRYTFGSTIQPPGLLFLDGGMHHVDPKAYQLLSWRAH